MLAVAAWDLRRPAIVAFLCALVAAGSWGAVEARADAPLLGTAEPGYQTGSAQHRRFLFDETAKAGAGVVRLNAFWFRVAPSRPADPRNPTDPAYRFDELDAAVRSATKRGLRVLLTLQRAPEWAESEPNGEDRGAWKPDVNAFGDYAHAVATRYSGSFDDPFDPAGPLPRVRYFQAWNEANLEKFYAPQRAGGRSVSADRYRLLLNHAHDELKAVDPANVVVVAGTGPKGPSAPTRTAPLEWWRRLLCLNDRLRPKPGCPAARFDVFDHHPITVEHPPTAHGRDGEILIADYHRLTRLLHAAERQGTVGGPAQHEQWASEIYWETDPPETRRGYPEKQAARFLEQGIYLLARQDVDVILNFFMIDAPLTRPGDVANVQGGLLDARGRRKDSFTAFRFPFVVDRRSKRSALAWGIAPRKGVVAIQRRRRGRDRLGWKTVARIRAGDSDVFRKRIPLRGRAELRARIRQDKSLVWEQAR